MNKSISKLLSGMALLLLAQHAIAAGPAVIAKSDRSLWPDPINSAAGFDRASRAEILVFADALAQVSDEDDATLRTTLHIKNIDRTSIQRVRDRLVSKLLDNMKAASASCAAGEPFCARVDTPQALIEAGRTLPGQLPAKYRAWYDNAAAFHHIYAEELIRLAALFGKVSSEIDTYGPGERNGFEMPDRHFLLTFDDGPTRAGGNTDTLLPVLRQNGIHGMFFVLGDELQKRIAATGKDNVQKLYAGQCVGLHGWVHKSHQHWSEWQTSVLDTQKLVTDVLPASYRPYFRPPYGQRRSDSGPFFASHHLTVELWNIDSQDWNPKVSETDAAQRVLTLMLLWRSGVILFHDVHTKAPTAVPWLISQTRQANITWDDCRDY
ncbi:MAG TPA: polysaccharide deacetylase family protein [Gallionellaceae bacterium]|nr:polysaccharide deacetylase family protein [Gallionellaceae bacterium]